MPQNAYTVGLKVKPPTILTQKPHKNPIVTLSLNVSVSIAVVLSFIGVTSFSLPILMLAGTFFLVYGAGRILRTQIHTRDKNRYHNQISNGWVSSNSFIKMRDFLVLMGFPTHIAYQIADELGTEVIYNKSYAQATGYYPLSAAEGVKTISAVKLETLFSKKDKIKLTVKVLQET